MKKILAILLLATLPITVPAGNPVTASPPMAGGFSTVVVAQLFSDTTDVTSNSDYEVRALIGGEVRAVGSTLELPDSTAILVFRIWGEIGLGGIDETGQTITFIMHNRATGRDYDISTDDTITFRGDYTYGQPSEPIALRFSFAQDIPIEALRAASDHIIVYQEEGDIHERLDSLITILPAESKQKFHWEVVRTTVPNMITLDEETGFINAKADGYATMVAVANADPTVRSQNITVNVINPARSLTFAEDGLIVYMNGLEALDISDDVNNRIHISPIDYTSIDISYTSSDPDVVSTRYDQANDRQLFQALKAGSAVITASLTYLDCFTESDTTVTLDFTIHVSLPLTAITVSTPTLQVCRDSVVTLTLRAQPEGAVLTANNINLTIADTRFASVGSFEVADGASSVEVPIEGLFPGTTEILNAIQPDGQASRLATVDVVIPMQLSEGWQWVTCYQPTSISGSDLEAAFGAKLTEVRSQDKTLFNDPDYGYIGSLYESGLRQNEYYKINMAADASHLFERPEGDVVPYAGGSIRINSRWTWIANPYYCSHPLLDYISGAQEEDMIVSQDAYAVYYAGEWYGSLETLRYGEAYMYYSELGYGTLEFKEEGYVSDNIDENDNEEEEEVKAFRPIGNRKYMDNMCLTAKLDLNDNLNHTSPAGGLQGVDNWEIGAFVGNDCRGTARSKDGLFFLSVHGNVGETVSLKLYNKNSGTYYDIQKTTELQPRIGSIRNPLQIRKGDNGHLTVDNGEATEDYYYTLQGIRLRQAPRKGIYIHNGQKVAVR